MHVGALDILIGTRRSSSTPNTTTCAAQLKQVTDLNNQLRAFKDCM